MPSLVLALVFAAAPAATDRGAAEAEAPTAVEAWTPAPADPPPAAVAPTPAPMPMPVPVAAPTQPPPPAVTQPPPPSAGPPTPPPTRKRTWPDRPIRWRVDLGGDIGTTVNFDPAWRAFDDNRSAFHAGGTIRGDFRLGDGRVFLGGGASFRRFASYNTLYQAFGADITVREPLAFLRLAVVVREGFDVFAHVGGGPSFTALSLSSWTSTYNSGYQQAVTGMADAQAGVSLYLPKKWLPRRGAARATAGFELSAGYTFRSKIKVRPEPDVYDDPLPTHSSDLGDLAVRGFVWRFGVFVRFQ
ncbi:hypothetical protein SAMN02745121_04003 [Nannocystis exedens]|uniref:Outer membrane protein beta-barrel domain-containing protein n=1 Tax=Nannocystis exedens TaxID=54 RepID=A0A1I1ZZS7_9BACT|nr:hypothetical protein [Nannocystis exedens]PCC75274.1 hypothetical protein NAEX_08383 [Nannocystis exedens]SFE35980.1 hypothetical protein SAMN02745121_04003 [Nannocystis exedens]